MQIGAMPEGRSKQPPRTPPMIDLPRRLTHSLSLRGSVLFFGDSLLSLSPKRRQAIPPPRLILLARLQIEAHPSPLPGTRAPHWPSNGRERWCQFSNASIASVREEDPAPVHIVHFGDSHSAADDWTGELRRLLKEKFGDGGSGFSLAGRPFAGYHRYDVQEGGSAGSRSDGLRSASGDGFFGLGGISSSAAPLGQSVFIDTNCDHLEIDYLQQPDGGDLALYDHDELLQKFSTSGELGPGIFTYQPAKTGVHHFILKTLDSKLTRLFGWVSDKNTGVTYEALGINGTEASVILHWDEKYVRHLSGAPFARVSGVGLWHE